LRCHHLKISGALLAVISLSKWVFRCLANTVSNLSFLVSLKFIFFPATVISKSGFASKKCYFIIHIFIVEFGCKLFGYVHWLVVFICLMKHHLHLMKTEITVMENTCNLHRLSMPDVFAQSIGGVRLSVGGVFALSSALGRHVDFLH
jgi:hypothetical protein